MNPYTLSRHALERLDERTSISPENIHEMMDSGIEMPYSLESDRAVRMFWSQADDRAYLAFYDRGNRMVITIYEAYKWIGETFRGKTYTHRCHMGNAIGVATTKVHRTDVAFCRRQIGLPDRPEFHSIPPKYNPPGTGALYAFEWVARFSFVDGLSRVFLVTSIPFGEDPDNISSDTLVSALYETIVRRGVDLDKVLNVVLEMRKPKRGKIPAGPPVNEIELDQFTLKENSPAPYWQEHGMTEHANCVLTT